MASVSVVIQFFEDFDFIERVVERLAWVDEIVVNDGPFHFTRELLEPLVGRDLEQPSPRAAHVWISRRQHRCNGCHELRFENLACPLEPHGCMDGLLPEAVWPLVQRAWQRNGPHG